MIRRVDALALRRWAALPALAATCAACVPPGIAQATSPLPALRAPLVVYSNGAAYGELSAHVSVSEDAALGELDEMLRLKRAGVRFDYSVMDGAWFAPGGGYRAWRTDTWPQGPNRWIAKCRANGIRPGLWFPTNTLAGVDPAPAWKNSLDQDGQAMSLFEGGFLPDFVSVLEYWYSHGIRIFEFGSLDLTAATPAAAARLSQQEIETRNARVFRNALAAFHRQHPAAVLLVVDGPVADLAVQPPSSPGSAVPLHLGAFQIESTGELEPSNLPESDVWRSVDISTDSTVRRYEQLGIPLQRIESPAFIVGKTGGHDRGIDAWKGSFLLAMARDGWINTAGGNLELIRGPDAIWMARAQRLFLGLQAQGRFHTFGGAPGGGQPYGFAATTVGGSVYVAVNPSQTVASIALPQPAAGPAASETGRVQFRDAGFLPRLMGNKLTLGPGQMAMAGYGAYATPRFNLGVQQDIVIPQSIEPVSADFQAAESGAIEAGIDPPIYGVLRVIMRRRIETRPAASGDTLSSPNARPSFTIEATQNGRMVPIRIDEDASPWNGLSWAVGEIDVYDLTPGVPVHVKFRSNRSDPHQSEGNFEGSAYQVIYDP